MVTLFSGFSGHVSSRLAAYVDGELTERQAWKVERHIASCTRCRAECDRVRAGMTAMKALPLAGAPDAIWVSIETALASSSETALASSSRERFVRWRPGLVRRRPALVVSAALTLAALLATMSWRLTHRFDGRWSVVALAGSPSVGAVRIHEARRAGAGDWIETDSAARATIRIGEIGTVEVSPNTRLRIVTARADEHRLALARGAIRAAISAPPRLFFVDTASGTAVDLGCEYTLTAGEDGVGLLSVTRGWVSFQWHGLESLVPAGASCRTQPGAGPGVPYFDDAPGSVKDALEAFVHEKTGSGALNVILAESRVRDTLTLWHLLSRVDAGDRGRVYDRIAALTPVPNGVSRAKAVDLDRDTLRRWLDELAWTW
jgi:anti-sigma factor RsiW